MATDERGGSGQVSYEDVFAGHALPIARFRRWAEGEYEPIEAVGSGFTFGEGTFVTCWHCVNAPLGEDEAYGVAMRSGGIESQRYDEVFDLVDLEQVAGGRDLALARVGFTVDPVLALADDPAAWGADVVACGYPLPVNTRDPDTRDVKIDTNACLLRGYVTRLRMDDRPGWPPVRAYELDMPAPGGVSGSPLFRPQPFEVVGVVYRENDLYVPGRQVPVTFAYAHHLSTDPARGASRGNREPAAGLVLGTRVRAAGPARRRQDP
jgi:Trypsin-like peptidase domain